MKKIFYSLSTLLISFSGISQSYIGTKVIGEGGFNITTNISHNPGQDILISGFIGSDLTKDFPVQFKGGNNDGVVIRLDETNGTIQNIYHFGGGQDEAVMDAVLDSEGNAYIMGYFKGAGSMAMDADPGPDEYPLSVVGAFTSRDLFIVKLDSKGSFVWAKQVSNSFGAANEDGLAIDVDVFGNVYVVGNFILADFDPSSNTQTIFSTNNGQYIDGFMFKLNGDGELEWVNTYRGIGTKKVREIKVVEDKIFIAGTFNNEIDLNPEENDTVLFTSNGGDDIFFGEYDLGGHYIWGQSFGSKGTDMVAAIEVLNDAIYMAGGYSDTIDFDPSVNEAIENPRGVMGGYVTKYDMDGMFIDANTFTGDDNTLIQMKDMIITRDNALMLSGSYSDSLYLHTEAYSSMGSSDNFYVKYSDSLDLISAEFISGENSLGTPFYAELTNDNEVFVGSFKGTVQFDKYGGTEEITAISQYEIYITQTGTSYLGVKENIETGNLVLYPNPTSGIFKINDEQNQNLQVEIYNAMGKLVSSKMIRSNEGMDINNLENGVYIIRTTDNEGNMHTSQLVKN